MPASPAAAARSRVVVPGRVWQVLLFLGGFLVLAFILSGQAHADSPDNRFGTSAPVQTPSLFTTVERGADQSMRAGTAQAGSSVQGTVAAATESGTDRSDLGLFGAVQDVTHQATGPFGKVIGSLTTGHGGSGHRTTGRRTSAWRTAVRHDATRSHDPAARAAGHPGAPAAGSAPAGFTGSLTPSRAPGGVPASAQHTEHPVESDGGAHHTGGAYAAVPAVGTSVHLGAAVPPGARGSAPLTRASTISVVPD